VAGSRLDKRTVAVEGSVSEALGVLSSAGSLVGAGSRAARVVLVSAHLSTVLGLSGGGRSGGRSVTGGGNARGGGVVNTSDSDGTGLGNGDGLVAVGKSGLLRAVGGQLGDDLSGVDGLDRLGGLGTLVASSRLDELAALPRVEAKALSVLGGALGHVGTGSNAALIELVGAHLSAVAGVGRLGRSIASSGGNGLGDGARAVLNGEGGGLGDSVGLVTVGQGGGSRAVGGQVSDNLGGVVDSLVGRRSIVRRGVGGTEEGASESGSLDETHCDGWLMLERLKRKKRVY